MSVDDKLALEDALEPLDRWVSSLGDRVRRALLLSVAFVFGHRFHERDESATGLGSLQSTSGLLCKLRNNNLG
jgi:hypothetical protein